MALPNISSLRIQDNGSPVQIPDDIANSNDRELKKLKGYARSLPYSIESNSEMMKLLDFILLRITQCIEAKDFDVGMVQWDSMVSYWLTLRYPIPKDKLIPLATVYFHISTTPGMSTVRIATAADLFRTLTKSKKTLSIEDLRLPWRPIYDILSQDLFLTRRQFEYTQLSWCMGYMADNANRFFHPAAIDEMLSRFIPQIGDSLDSILSTQYYLLSFLPLSHPQSYLPMLFRLWESINSYMYDERMLHFLSKLAEIHVSPEVSDPRKIAEIPDDAQYEGEERPRWSQEDLSEDFRWSGLYKSVGIFTEYEWSLLMCKCLASMEIPLADGGSLTTGPSADNRAGFELGRLPRARWRISSLAHIIVYSMAPDGIPTPSSNAPTPFLTPLPSGMNTPHIQTSTLGDYLSAPLGRSNVQSKNRTYLAGSKALDSLARLIASTESFFHPSNSGTWTEDLSAFIKYVVYDFNKRWHEEELPDCKTPKNRRLTATMKRELVKSLRTVALLAMFSSDSTTVTNIQSCLKSMCVMEPDLILHPILERAVPSLEALTETQRTIAVIKALGAIAPAIVSREVYYPGAKHLVPILELLLPGIDLNDPSKTLCTTSFLVEISQYVKFGDLTTGEEPMPVFLDAEPILPREFSINIPAMRFDGLNDLQSDMEPRLSDQDEDSLLKQTTGSFADWITSFIRRVIQLLENLPEEGPDGSSGGATEVQVVDAVCRACSQICVHLSEPLFDLVLKMIFEYASTNVRSNAVRAIHQLVECIATANPDKTLAKFLPFCSQNIRLELENGASSLRTTSASSPLPSDATLHWNLAILRGTVYNDGRAVLKYRDEFTSLLQLLHAKTLSKRGFSWTGKLLSSMLFTLTHTYPLENKFVNPDEWNSEEFRWNHHRHWGKLYKAEDVKVSWHVPNAEEIDFTLQIFKLLIEPTISVLDGLLNSDIRRDATWRNDFCRHLSFVCEAFSGIPTLYKDYQDDEAISKATATSDILGDIPEMIAFIPPIESGFCLTDPTDHRYQYIKSLRHRFGELLHRASVSLNQQGEENTVDAVDMLVRAIRTYMLEYGDSRDSYYVNEDQYATEKNVARQYGSQRVWPRAVFVRRARYYHSARLRWNSIDRLRGPLEDSLIDDLVEWSMWHYAVIRQSSQSLLESLCSSYDGIRRRVLPRLYKALGPGTEDDRMKGALWTLNSPSFGRYAVGEPTLASEFLVTLLRCQHNEKASVQDCVSVVSENCLNSFVEPCYLVYSVSTLALEKSSAKLKTTILYHEQGSSLTERCRLRRIKRIEEQNTALESLTAKITDIAESISIHWRYAIVAVRCLRTLVRRDVPLHPRQIRFFMQRTHDSHPTIRYYAQRAVMKSLRNIKLRTYCQGAADLYFTRSQNPLKQDVHVQPSQSLTSKVMNDFRIPYRFDMTKVDPLFLDQQVPGLIAWRDTISLYKTPNFSESTFQPWETASEPVISAVRELTTNPSFWKNLQVYFSEENHELTITQDNVSVVKSIFQLLEDEPFEALRPSLEKLINDKDQDKQRAAAELLAGLLNGSKHWPISKQEALWEWFKPWMKRIFKQNLKTDTLSVWTSFTEYMFHKKDPRRLQPLVDLLIDDFKSLDFNAELSFDVIKVLSVFRAFYEELGCKFSAWADEVLERCWPEIHGDHDDVREYISEMLAFTARIKRQAKPSLPTVEVFVKECRVLPIDYDIVGMRGTYHRGRVSQLVENFKVWREERVPGSRAFQSKYDRVGVTICKWLFQAMHDIYAFSVFDYILPLMPELFRFTEVNDNDELATRASVLLVRMCGVTPPRCLVNPILEAIFEAIQSSPSWKVRLKALPLVQVFYFRQVPLIEDAKVVEILEVLCKCLDDQVVEVREMAATTLSGILRLSPWRSVLTFKNRFVRLAKNSHIPGRHDPGYNNAIRQRHAAILGLCALVDSFPYTIEKWMPDLLTTVLAEHTYDPLPISTTVRQCARNFKKTHQDTWHEDCKKFNEDQLSALSTLLTGSSYYA